jgi:uncharacterized protein (TIGR00106 family)
MIAEFSIVPLSVGDSLSFYVSKVMQIVEKSGIPYKLTSMGTIIEGNEQEVFDLIKQCHCEMRKYSKRVLTKINIDDREGKLNRMTQKVQAVREKMNDEKKL